MPNFYFHPVAPDDRTYRLTCRANEYFERHHYKEAVIEYTKTIMAMGPSDGKDRQSATDFSALIYSNRSASYCMLKQWSDAENDATYVMKIRPAWAKGYFRCAEALVQMHKYDEAIELYQKALDREPDNTDISSRIAKALIMKDNADMGLTVLQLVPGRDIATERSLTTPIQNKIFDFAEAMRNIVYVIADSDSNDCVIVDACWDVDGILSVVRREGYRVVAALVTHYHFDHVGGAPPPPYDTLPIKVSGLATLLKRLPHIKAYIHPLDIPYIQQANPSVLTSRIVPTCTETTTSLHLGTRTTIRFIHCPGHTPGSQAMLVNECRLLSGDTLLCGLCGRTDLPGGSKAEMEHTLRHVLGGLDDHIVVMPGHNYGSEWSTIGIEKDKGCLGEDLVGYGYIHGHSHTHNSGTQHMLASDIKSSDTQSVRSSVDTVRSTSTAGSGGGNDKNGSSWSVSLSSTLTTTTGTGSYMSGKRRK